MANNQNVQQHESGPLNVVGMIQLSIKILGPVEDV